MNDSEQSAMVQLPIIIILTLIFGAGFFMLKGDVNIPFLKKSNSLSLRRIDRFPTTIEVDHEIDKMRHVIKNENELKEFFNAINPSLTLGENINFDKEYLIAVSTKSKEDNGISMKIKRIEKDQKDEDEELIVRLIQTEYSPETCVVEEKQTVALDIVAIDKTDKEFHFVRVLDEQNCQD